MVMYYLDNGYKPKASMQIECHLAVHKHANVPESYFMYRTASLV